MKNDCKHYPGTGAYCGRINPLCPQGICNDIAGLRCTQKEVEAGNHKTNGDLKTIQTAQNEWARKNFGQSETWQPLLGAVEELGELSHAHLKQSQGIRTNEDHEANAKDAVGDTVMYLMDYCSLRGWCLDTIIKETWEHISKRDWKENSENGQVPG